MSHNKQFCLIVFLLFVMLVSTALSGSIDERSEEYLHQRRAEKREIVQGGSKALLKLLNPPSRELVITERVFQYLEWDSEIWINWDRELFYYDNNAKLTNVPLYYWDEFSEQWYDSFYRTYITWNNDLIDEIKLRYEEDSLEYDSMIITQTFNNSGQVTEIIWEEYDDYFQELVYEMIYQFLYDDDDRIEAIVMTENTPDGSFWMNIYLFYDDNGRMLELIDEVSLGGEDWMLNERTLIEYHPDDQSGYTEVQSFFNFLGLNIALDNVTWLPAPMFDAQYFYIWSASSWILKEREAYTYYQDNNIETIALESYVTDNQWEPMDRYLYLYNTQGFLEELLHQYYYYGGWDDQYRVLLYMDEHTDVEDEILQPSSIDITNYPNPFNPETTIQFQLNYSEPINLSIINIKGQRVRTLINEYRAAGEHRYNWDGKDDVGEPLPSGIYFYHLSGKTFSISGKMLLLK